MPTSCLLEPTARRCNSHLRLEGKVAVITGGASGIGESTARLFVKHGAKVIIGDVQDDLGHSICKEFGSDDALSFMHCDVTNESHVQRLVDTAVSKYGKLDIMFSNAGILGSLEGAIIASAKLEDFKRVFDVNVNGAFLAAKHAARVMGPAKKGSIIITASNTSVISSGAPHSYTASKHAVVGLAKNMCAELGQYGVRVNCISPSVIVTPLVMNSFPKIDKEHVESLLSEAGNLKGSVLKTEDVAEAALYLGSDESKYVSGLNLVMDGGYYTNNNHLSNAVGHLFS